MKQDKKPCQELMWEKKLINQDTILVNELMSFIKRKFDKFYKEAHSYYTGYWELKDSVKNSKEMQELQNQFNILRIRRKQNQIISKQLKTEIKNIQKAIIPKNKVVSL